MIQIGELRIPTVIGERGWDPDKQLETACVPCGCKAHKDNPERYVVYLQPGEELPEGATMLSLVNDVDDLGRISKSQTFMADILTNEGGPEAYFEQRSSSSVRTSVTLIGIGGLGTLFEEDDFGSDTELRDLLRQAGLGGRGGSIFDLLGRIRSRRGRNPFGG